MAILSTIYEKPVPFHDLDPLSVVWHGNYVAYMEEAREAFLDKYALRYMQMAVEGYIEPVTKVDITYKGSFLYGDTIVIEIVYVPTKKARIDFAYKFYRKSDGQLMTEARSTHVFVKADTKEVAYNRPDFYKEWQERWKVFE